MKIFHFVLIVILYNFMTITKASDKEFMKVQIFKMPEMVETSSITTAGHYILSSHLVRSLLKLDKVGSIQADLVTKWISSHDKKEWTFTIGNEKFSNGESITTNDVVNSINRQIKFKTGVHFPFTEIEEAQAINEKEFKVKLKNSRNDFIYDLTKPEFGVLYSSDQKKEKNHLELKVTSGPYYLSKKDGYDYTLIKNPFFKADVRNIKNVILF